MRQKPANENALANLISFINEINADSRLTPAEPIDVKQSIKSNNVAKRSFGDLKALGYIKVKGDEVKYISKESPRVMALKILDHRLNQSKRTIHFPIPDFAGISQSLETIVERMAHLLSLSERSLKSAKNSLVSEDADLFKVNDQRLYIAGQIASAAYSIDPILLDVYPNTNDSIIKATDDLMKRLLNKNAPTIKKIEDEPQANDHANILK